MINRELANIIRNQCGKGKAIIIVGARQTGKSTVLQQLFAGEKDVIWFNGDDYDVRAMFDILPLSSA